jgi:hypothetical protein
LKKREFILEVGVPLSSPRSLLERDDFTDEGNKSFDIC